MREHLKTAARGFRKYGNWKRDLCAAALTAAGLMCILIWFAVWIAGGR